MPSPQIDGELLPMSKITRVLCLPCTQWGLFCMAGWNQRDSSGWWTDCCLTPHWPPCHDVHCFISHRPSAADSLRRASTGGEYRFFLSIKTQRDERTLPPAPELRLLSFSFSSHSMLSSDWGSGGGEGRLGDQRRSREQNTDQQQGGNWCPRYLAYVIDPELKINK